MSSSDTKGEQSSDKPNDGRCHACGCVGPNPGYSPMTEAEVAEEYETINKNMWRISEDSKSIRRHFVCRNFQAAIAAINAMGEIAERSDIQHHPDLHLTKYREVEVVLNTHAVDGLTRFDFVLAKALESVTIDYSPKWLKSNPLIN